MNPRQLCHFEVELKFRVDDSAELRRQLHKRGIICDPPLREIDWYFAHPSRDFARTDEALRVRLKNDRALITYKGPKLDVPTKTRAEIELPLGDGEAAAAQWRQLLEVLGFWLVAQVSKAREKGQFSYAGRRIEVSLDHVEGLGEFAELELVVDSGEMAKAQQVILAAARELGLSNVERRSYLELLLEAIGGRDHSA